jgi:hypothetical protein
MEKLTGLLYRKNMAENSMEKFGKGIKMYSDYCKQITIKLKEKGISKLEKSKLKVELDKMEWETRIFVTSYKSTRREYQHTIIPEIERTATDEEKTQIEFINHQKEADKLSKIELYGKANRLPANIEHIEIINLIKKNISVIEDVIKFSEQELKIEKDEFVLAKIRKDLFDSELHLLTLNKRLRSREDYYLNQFMPIYTLELAEAKEKIEMYYERGLKISETGIDVQLHFVLEKYEEHTDTDERLWLYYTSLKSRINGIMNEIKKDPVKFSDILSLSDPI